MPEPLTAAETEQLQALIFKGTGLRLLAPNPATAANLITELHAAVAGPFQTILRDADPRQQHKREHRPWDD
jgi:hypothetical protein